MTSAHIRVLLFLVAASLLLDDCTGTRLLRQQRQLTEKVVCVNATKTQLTLAKDIHGNAEISVGMCIKLPEGEKRTDFPDQSLTTKVPDPSNRIFSLTYNSTCHGFTITNITHISDPSSYAADDSLALNTTCPKGQVPIRIHAQPPWRITTTTGRGVGKVPSSCAEGYEETSALCYPKCRSGYYGVGPVCWQSCPSGFKDTGTDCLKPPSYGRGAGSIPNIFHGDSCPSSKPDKWGGLCYSRCKEGFHNVACCVCSPNCPDGMVDIGVSCQKHSYGRGAGSIPRCSSSQDYDAGLCYHQCPSGAHGVGPLCYASCTSGDPYRLGIWCFHSESERNKTLGAIIGGVLGGAILLTVGGVAFAPLIASLGSATVAVDVGLADSLMLFTPEASLSLLSVSLA